MTTPLSRLKAAETQFDGRTVIVRADDLAKILALARAAKILALVDPAIELTRDREPLEEALTALNEETET